MLRLAAVALSGLVLVPAALAAAPSAAAKHLTEQRATKIFLGEDKVADWVGRYPKGSLVTQATYERTYRDWSVHVWSGAAGETATGRVDDLTGAVTEAWTGPQVAWQMARGVKGAFGGKELNSAPVWLFFCGAFLIGLGDLRRPLSLRNLDLLALLSFTVSLWFFNKGRVFTSVPLAYPPLLYLLGRAAWIGVKGRGSRGLVRWPVWLLVAATVFLAGFRIGLVVESSNVIDVGYSGVIGAQRISSGQSPYGHMPVADTRLKPCSPPDREGTIPYRIQTNGRCESADEHGDTYGPVSYQAYLPGYWALGWRGKGDRLNAARFTTILFDSLCLAGLALVGWRFGRAPLAATLAFAWVAYPFTQYAASSNTNDLIQPAFMILGFWLVTSPVARGVFGALAAWVKFAPLLVAPLWASYPERRARPAALFALAFVVATALAFWILLLEPDPLHAARVFFRRSIRWQVGRDSPFSIWDWRQYHAGLPDLHVLQWVLSILLVVGAVTAGVVPRRKTPLQLAALTAAILIGFELVQTHWFYLYLPWFFPFLAYALLAPSPSPARATEALPESGDRERRELVAAG